MKAESGEGVWGDLQVWGMADWGDGNIMLSHTKARKRFAKTENNFYLVSTEFKLPGKYTSGTDHWLREINCSLKLESRARVVNEVMVKASKGGENSQQFLFCAIEENHTLFLIHYTPFGGTFMVFWHTLARLLHDSENLPDFF